MGACMSTAQRVASRAWRERSIFSPAFIPDGNVRRDTGANQPAQELGCAVGCISGETFGLKSHPLICALDHHLRGHDLVIGPGRVGSTSTIIALSMSIR